MNESVQGLGLGELGLELSDDAAIAGDTGALMTSINKNRKTKKKEPAELYFDLFDRPMYFMTIPDSQKIVCNLNIDNNQDYHQDKWTTTTTTIYKSEHQL